MIQAVADAVALRTVVPIALLEYARLESPGLLAGVRVVGSRLARNPLVLSIASLVLLSSVGSALTLNLWLLLLA